MNRVVTPARAAESGQGASWCACGFWEASFLWRVGSTVWVHGFVSHLWGSPHRSFPEVWPFGMFTSYPDSDLLCPAWLKQERPEVSWKCLVQWLVLGPHSLTQGTYGLRNGPRAHKGRNQRGKDEDKCAVFLPKYDSVPVSLPAAGTPQPRGRENRDPGRMLLTPLLKALPTSLHATSKYFWNSINFSPSTSPRSKLPAFFPINH